MSGLFLKSGKLIWLVVVLFLFTIFPSAAFAAPSATPYKLEIIMDDATVKALQGYYLCGFKAVRANTTASPVVWFSTPKFGKDTNIAWEEIYQAYTSTSDIIPGGTVTATNNYDIDLGGILYVDDNSGSGHVVTQGGSAGQIVFVNNTSNPFTSGISQQASVGGQSTMTPLCAFRLLNGFAFSIAPIEKVVLMFCAKSIDTGAVILNATSSAIQVDMTNTQKNSKTIFYNINAKPEQQWSSNDPNDQYIPALTALQNYLIFNDKNSLIRVQSCNADLSSTTNTIQPRFRLINTGKAAIDLSVVKLRYYFTNDDMQDNVFKPFSLGVTKIDPSQITGKFFTIKTKNADRYLEIGFAKGAGILASGASAEVGGVIYKTDGGKFLQENDYSFTPSSSYKETKKITCFLSKALVWGDEP